MFAQDTGQDYEESARDSSAHIEEKNIPLVIKGLKEQTQPTTICIVYVFSSLPVAIHAI